MKIYAILTYLPCESRAKNRANMTINPTLDTRYRSKDGTYPVIIRMRHKTKVKDEPTGWKVEEKFWNGDRVVKHRESVVINSKIAELVSKAENYRAKCKLSNRPINLDFVFSGRESYSFSGYLLHRAKQYEEKEMWVMGRKVRRFDREFRVLKNPNLTFAELQEDAKLGKPLRGEETYFDEITADLIRDYDTLLISHKNVNNTRAKKFEFLGKFYDDAIDEGKALAPNPFKKYKIAPKPPRKEKLTASDIEKLEKLNLQPGPVNDARNMALFSYYCKGTRFENVLTFHRSQIRDGRIYVRTNKGNKFISVKIHSRLQRILDQYPDDYLFVDSAPTDKKAFLKWKDSKNVIINRNIKTACSLAGIKKNISFHRLRDRFAQHLKEQRADIHVIKEALGHSKTSTTEMYLASLGDEEIDKDMDKLYGD